MAVGPRGGGHEQSDGERRHCCREESHGLLLTGDVTSLASSDQGARVGACNFPADKSSPQCVTSWLTPAAAGDEGEAGGDTAGEGTREGAGGDPDEVGEIEQGDHAHRKVERRAGQVERRVVEHRGKDEEGEKAYGEHAQELLPREQREKSRRFGARSGSRGLAR